MGEGEGRTQIAKEHENVLDDAIALYLRDEANGMLFIAKQNSLVCSPRMSVFIMWCLHNFLCMFCVFLNLISIYILNKFSR